MTYEALQEQTLREMPRRVAVLSQQVASWTAESRTDKMGVSSTQRLALLDLMKIIVERQNTALDRCAQNRSPSGFADAHVDLLLEMTGAQELWQAFRTILGQHEDPTTEVNVKAASRIAGDCYAFCIRRAREWGVLTPDKFREQPLVYLQPVESPATAGRQNRLRALSSTIRQWRDLKLPLPIVLLPFHYSDSFWTFCSLHHEVGHNVDQDLNILTELRSSLLDFVPERESHWRRWSSEIVADTFGVILGGAGFAFSISGLALMLGTAGQFKSLDEEAVHPPFLLRVRLIAEMLKLTEVPGLLDLAAQLDAIWTNLQKPDWLKPFSDEATKIAEHFLKKKLAVLHDHALLELNPAVPQDYERTNQLANFFLTGTLRPVPSKDTGMHPRLVPCAAELAFRQKPTLSTNVLQDLQSEALKYMDLIPAIETLAAPVAFANQRGEYLKQLARNIDFSS